MVWNLIWAGAASPGNWSRFVQTLQQLKVQEIERKFQAACNAQFLFCVSRFLDGGHILRLENPLPCQKRITVITHVNAHIFDQNLTITIRWLHYGCDFCRVSKQSNSSFSAWGVRYLWVRVRVKRGWLRYVTIDLHQEGQDYIQKAKTAVDKTDWSCATRDISATHCAKMYNPMLGCWTEQPGNNRCKWQWKQTIPELFLLCSIILKQFIQK